MTDCLNLLKLNKVKELSSAVGVSLDAMFYRNLDG